MKKLLILLVFIALPCFASGGDNNYSTTGYKPSKNDYKFGYYTAINYMICKKNGGGDACINYMNVEAVDPNFHGWWSADLRKARRYAHCSSNYGGNQACFDRELGDD